MKKFLLGAVAASVLAFSGNAMANFVAGQDYQVVAKPVKVEKPGRIEVREFFWYGCGHCFALEPHMQGWLKKITKRCTFCTYAGCNESTLGAGSACLLCV